MTISYKWLSEYLPETIEPEKLSRILTSIGLEVESLEPYETIKGGLLGLVIGEVLSCEKHPDADKLSLTTVNVGNAEPLQIVCGAPNVAKGQKVVVATVGSTIYPTNGEPMTMKKAKIRGVESHGMICAEDEIGMGTSHDGIMILKPDAIPGTPAVEYFVPYSDWIYEIGLTPNRMDAMSHLGVARDVCAWLTNHEKKSASVKSPFKGSFKADKPNGIKIGVTIENKEACQRYSAVCISGVTIKESPGWLQQRLKAIGVRPINNVVDITNFILHETGQPLHAFDANEIKGNQVIVKNLPAGTPFVTLDGKERKLDAEDLMICNADSEGMCIAGVFGGVHSGVTESTKDIFLESAWFHPVSIRKTSFRHGLRTDAATRFEKGVDISNTVNVLKRAALMIKELAGGEIASDVIDVYPAPKEKLQVPLKYHYLKKLSGKNYHPDAVRQILESLGFTYLRESANNELWFEVPYSKPDVTLPADIVEEIMRIDGLDNVEIPSVISMSPAMDTLAEEEAFKDKVCNTLVGLGFSEIFTNSITNSKYYPEEVLSSSIKMINNLSADLDIMRPSMLETGLEVIAHNLNRRNNNLQLFEFGQTYGSTEVGKYEETKHCSIYVTGMLHADHWKEKAEKSDFYYLKAVVNRILQSLGLDNAKTALYESDDLYGIEVTVARQTLIKLGMVSANKLERFDIKQQVLYADLLWEPLVALAKKQKTEYKEIPKFPSVERDLALVVDKSVPYSALEEAAKKAKLSRMTAMQLFDVFESDKLGAGKKSMAVNFTFQDNEKTLTDQEIDKMMQQLIKQYESELGAEVRK